MDPGIVHYTPELKNKDFYEDNNGLFLIFLIFFTFGFAYWVIDEKGTNDIRAYLGYKRKYN